MSHLFVEWEWLQAVYHTADCIDWVHHGEQVQAEVGTVTASRNLHTSVQLWNADKSICTDSSYECSTGKYMQT